MLTLRVMAQYVMCETTPPMPSAQLHKDTGLNYSLNKFKHFFCMSKSCRYMVYHPSKGPLPPAYSRLIGDTTFLFLIL